MYIGNREKISLLALKTFIVVFRWRKLSGIDPEKSDLLSKVQTLQKFVNNLVFGCRKISFHVNVILISDDCCFKPRCC